MDNASASLLLRECGLRVTLGRVLLLLELMATRKPVSAEELHVKTPSLDLVTVYRALQSFAKSGLAREVRFKDATVRYEFAGDTHHHHLVCTGCGTIDELPECDVTHLEKTVLQHSKRFAKIDEHALEFFGTCVSCAKR